MGMTEKIRILLVKRGNISEAEVARRLGISPQNLNKKMKRDNFTVSDLEKIAGVLGGEFTAFFEISETNEQV